MQQFFIDVLTVRPYFRSIEVKNIFIELKSLDLFMQLALVLYAEMLNLLYFNQVINDEFFVHGKDVG